MSDNNKWDLVFQLLCLALKHGLPAVKDVIATWSEELTPEQLKAKIEEARANLRQPEDYFK